MALVGYSDSEGSDADEVVETKAPKINTKKAERVQGNKIKIDLPSIRSETSNDGSSEPASKRQRTAGAFSGFNSLLPAPKRTAQSSIKPGFTLKTSSEAAFSRVPPPQPPIDSDAMITDGTMQGDAAPAEPKLVGKATRFLPLSVANAKKKKKPTSTVPRNAAPSEVASRVEPKNQVVADEQPKVKQSLFSMAEADDKSTPIPGTYEPEFSTAMDTDQEQPVPYQNITAHPQQVQSTPDSALQNVASDLNLTEAERRRLFGRNANGAEVKIANFNMDAEYRANQQLAANGGENEQRVVKAIAPGRHSLQQLLNNARGQTDALEDKWAEGRRNRGEAGSKYGF